MVKGRRGEWYLVVQAGLLLLLAFGPRSCQGVTPWGSPYTWIGSLVGGVLILAGFLLAATGAVNLGKNLTPLPRPKENATLIVSGAYRLVRHPIYSGITFMAFGWGLWLHSWLVIGYALLLLPSSTSSRGVKSAGWRRSSRNMPLIGSASGNWSPSSTEAALPTGRIAGKNSLDSIL